MFGLTERQKEILKYVQEFIDSEGMPPTVYEIGDHFGIKTSSVFAHLNALQKKGFIKRTSKARSISIKEGFGNKKPKSASIPLLRKINAGLPQQSLGMQEDYVSLDRNFFKLGDSSFIFCLNVSGDSMRDEGILDGDTVVVRKDSGNIRDGDIIVALLDKTETTVKKIYSAEGGRIELRPANGLLKTRYYNPDKILIQGKVIGVMRSCK